MINGRAGSGKDEMANYLVDNYNFVHLTFADGIYQIANNIFGMKTKDRKLLQDIGEKMREIHPDIWVEHVVRQIMNLPQRANIVVSDCRRANEHQRLMYELGFTGVQIQADEEIRRERIRLRDGVEPDMSLLENKSEIGADNLRYDYLVSNNDSLSDLYKTIDDIIKIERGNF